MTVATEREDGLFINGELVEPQSGDASAIASIVSTSARPFNPLGL